MKIFKLIKAEIIKLFSKKSTIVLLSVVCILQVLLTVIYSIDLDDIYSYEYFGKDFLEYEYDDVKDKTDEASIIKAKVLQFEMDILDERRQNEDKIDMSWKQTVFENYIQAKADIFYLNLMQSGVNLENIDYTYCYPSLDISSSMSEAEIQELLNEKEVQKAKNYTMYINDNYMAYYEECLKNINDVQNSRQFLEISENSRERYNETEKVYNYLIDNKVVADNENNTYAICMNIIDSINTLANMKENIMTEEEYYASYDYQTLNVEYSKYLKVEESGIKQIENDIKVYWYALENNIQTAKDGSKNLASCSLNLTIIGIACIIISGAIVANEYTTGTIRFLLTRPVKRYKILLSKYVTMLLFTIGITIAVIVLTIITAGICKGFGDLFVPELSVVNEKVVKTAFIFSLLKDILINFVPILLTASIAFVVAVLTRSTAAAVGLGIGSWFLGSIANMILLSMVVDNTNFIQKFSVLKFTPLLYMDMSLYTENMFYSTYYGLNTTLGILVDIVYLALFVLIGFVVFNKRDN